jgi:hypothetical protein
VNDAVNSSFLLRFLESMPEVSAKVLADGHNANMKERKFEDVVKSAESRRVGMLVLVY